MEENKENLVESFEESLLNDDNKDLLATVCDTGLDAVITGGALDGVPILGILNGIFKVTKNFQTYRLCKKMVKFLYGLSDYSQRDKEKFLQEYTEANQEKGAEVLLAVIDKIDNANKITTLCNLMRAKINGEISIDNFIRLCQVIERLPYVDFKNLEKYKVDYSELGTDDVLYSSGVIYKSVIELNGSDKYKLNYIGKLLLKYGLLVDTDLDAPSSVSVPNAVTANSISDVSDIIVEN